MSKGSSKKTKNKNNRASLCVSGSECIEEEDKGMAESQSATIITTEASMEDGVY